MCDPSPKYFLVNLGNVHDWGVMINEGTDEQPQFRVLFKATRTYAEQLLEDLNRQSRAIHESKNLNS
jgi:hypothetical protein